MDRDNQNIFGTENIDEIQIIMEGYYEDWFTDNEYYNFFEWLEEKR